MGENSILFLPQSLAQVLKYAGAGIQQGFIIHAYMTGIIYNFMPHNLRTKYLWAQEEEMMFIIS